MNRDTGAPCVLYDTPHDHRMGHQGQAGDYWPVDGGEQFLRWVRTAIGTDPIEAHLTIPADAYERLLEDLDAPVDRSERAERLRSLMDRFRETYPEAYRPQGAFQFMTGPWPRPAAAERSGAVRGEATDEAARIGRTHWSGSVQIDRGAHTDPVTGCPWCISSDRFEQAKAAMQAISPGRPVDSPIGLLFALAVDELARERS